MFGPMTPEVQHQRSAELIICAEQDRLGRQVRRLRKAARAHAREQRRARTRPTQPQQVMTKLPAFP